MFKKTGLVICIKWNDVTSRFIKIDFGVRQCSVLSPLLKYVYVYASQRCFIVQ